jgi:hypothetical protein
MKEARVDGVPWPEIDADREVIPLRGKSGRVQITVRY